MSRLLAAIPAATSRAVAILALAAAPTSTPPVATPLRASPLLVGSAPSAKTNIIVILADDLGYADISAYPDGRFATPNIDRIGREGVRFADGYATAPGGWGLPWASSRSRTCSTLRARTFRLPI